VRPPRSSGRDAERGKAAAGGEGAIAMAVAATGEAIAFLVNGLTFVPVMLSLLLMRNLPVPQNDVRSRSGSWRHVVEGAAYIRREHTLLVLISLVAVSAVLAMPYTTLMPVFADTVLGPSARPLVQTLCTTLVSCRAPEALPLGLLLATVGLGAVVGALLVASLPTDAPRGRWLTAGNLVFPAALVFFSLNRSFLLAIPILFLAGMAFVAQNALANTLLQMQAPDHLRGRVMSFYALAFQTTMRWGGLQAGVMAERWGAVTAVASGALLALLYGLFVTVRFPNVRRLR
jgi:MFS-type transporter involved in bile tolerance (Atg22 family)